MADGLRPEFREVADRMAAEFGPVLGRQRASLGAERFARFTQLHGELQGMVFFLVLSVATAPHAGYSDDVLEALRRDAQDLRDAADQLANECVQLADEWGRQRDG